MSILTLSPAWRALEAHHKIMKQQSLCNLFAQDTQRFNKFSLQFNNILLDYSKHPINTQTVDLLLSLARQQDMSGQIARMFDGDKVNDTEDRAALHSALRQENSVTVDGFNVMPDIKKVLAKMDQFVTAVQQGKLRGYSGQPFTDVVNIGIGGSNLGPAMVTEALRSYRSHHSLATHFISDIDSTHLSEILQKLNPETTLFIIASKTFTTQETMINARAVQDWFLTHGGTTKDTKNHFIAVSSNPVEAEKFGIHSDNLFEFWDWVGGRYSLWSAIGLPIALAIGMSNFYLLLAGARAMDQHFTTTPLAENLPVMLGLIGIWQINFFGAQSHAILPYDQSLRNLPAYLQQLEMESNGKRTDRNGNEVDYMTGVVIWGGQGINSQHSFYQLLHQGTQIISADFLMSCKSHHPANKNHKLSLAHYFSQTEAMMRGDNGDEMNAQLTTKSFIKQATKSSLEAKLPHKIVPGNRPTTSILFKQLDPKTLGALIALYEHKVFVQSVVWNINPFDQWGVELGKKLAGIILTELEESAPVTSHDASTNGLINYYKLNQ